MSSTHTLTSKSQYWQDQEVKIINGALVCFSDVCVHEFSINDAEDTDLHSAETKMFYKWQTSAAGTWVINHAENLPYWITAVDSSSLQVRYKIMARFSKQNETFWKLKWT